MRKLSNFEFVDLFGRRRMIDMFSNTPDIIVVSRDTLSVWC